MSELVYQTEPRKVPLHCRPGGQLFRRSIDRQLTACQVILSLSTHPVVLLQIEHARRGTPGTTANLRALSGSRIQITRLGLLLSCAVFLSAPTAAGPRSIASLIEEAYRKNPNVHLYEQEIAAARGDRRIAGTWPNPDLSGQIGGKIYNSLNGKYLGTGPVWTVSLTQTFEFPGRVTLRKAIADKQIALARIALEQFRLSLRNRIEMLCYRLVAAQDRATATAEVAQRFRDLIALLVQRELAGPSPLIEMRILEGNAATVNRRATQAQIELQSAQFELNLLRGVSMKSAGIEVARRNVNLPTLPDSGQLIARADRRNFDLQTRRTELEQQGFGASGAQRAVAVGEAGALHCRGKCGRQQTRAGN